MLVHLMGFKTGYKMCMLCEHMLQRLSVSNYSYGFFFVLYDVYHSALGSARTSYVTGTY
jgi:hypothetical protein